MAVTVGGGPAMTMEVSYFSLASMLALVAFVAIMIPRSLYYLGRIPWCWVRGRREPVDGWLVAIALAAMACIGLGAVIALYSDRAHRMLDASAAATLAFLLFATPAVLQVLRAFSLAHSRPARTASRALVLLAILSLPASMAIPTAALLQAGAAGAQANAPPLFDDRFFTDNEVANDPEDYPIAAFLEQNFTWRRAVGPHRQMRGENFYREIPTYTGFWLDQTTNMLTFDAADTFGVLVSRITHVRANWAFSLMVFLYKLLCTLVLVAVTYDALLRPLVERLRHRHSRA
jgi:hypothetical protein